jgi:hypothetical protein
MAEFISTLADVSTMWFVFLTFVFCLIPLFIVGGMVYGMHRLLGALPPLFQNGQEGAAKVAQGADKASKSVAAPFIAASAFASQVRGVWHSLSQISRRKV